MIEKIGNLRIVSELGRGGMGVVYLAEHMHIDKKFAVKSLSAKYTDDPNSRQLLERLYIEGQNQALLDHPNIVQVTDLHDEQGQYFLVMEYVDGTDLGELIRQKGRLCEKEALPVMKAILSGLGFAHRKGMIHRDIKPSNVMVGNDARVRIMDFGLSILAGVRRLTMDGSGSCLTPWYASPEQITHPDHIDHRSDVYSLGIVFFEMLTGQVPFDGEPYSVINRQVNEPLPDPTKMVPEISQELSRIISKCTAKNPDKRFQGCDELLQAILAYEKNKEPGPKTRSLWTTAIVIAIACFAGAMFLFFRKENSGNVVIKKAERILEVRALVLNSVTETDSFCKSYIALPLRSKSLKKAQNMKRKNPRLISELTKNMENSERNINSSIKTINHNIKEMEKFSEAIVAEGFKDYLKSEPDIKKHQLSDNLFNYYKSGQIETNKDKLKITICSD